MSFKRRYSYLRSIKCDWLTAAFVAILNELSNLPAHQIGFMHVVWDMNDRSTRDNTESHESY